MSRRVIHGGSSHSSRKDHLLEVGRVEAQNDIHSKHCIDEMFEVQHASASILLVRDAPGDERNAVHDHHTHKQVPVQLARILGVVMAYEPGSGYMHSMTIVTAIVSDVR